MGDHDEGQGKEKIDDFIKTRVADKDKTIRKDAVKLLEFVLTFSPEANGKFELSEWVKKNIIWIDKNFGKENIYKINVHVNESTPHLHILVAPITRDGRLSAREIVGNRKNLIELQDSYADAMKKLGLERGISKSLKKENIYHESPNRWINRKSLELEKREQQMLEREQNIDFEILQAVKEKMNK